MSDAQQQPETAGQQMASDAEEEQTHVPAHDITTTTVSGSRVRRSTQKFTVDEPKADDTDDFEPPAGKGTKLKDIALVNDVVAALNKKHTEILKSLYLVMYARRFQLKNLKVIKEHILEFSGIPEQDDAKAREVLFAKIAKWKRNFIQEVMDVLGVDRSKKSFDEEEKLFDKDAIVNRLVDWLYNPHEKKGGRKPTTPKAAPAPKKTKKAEKTPAATKRKSTAKGTTAKKKQKTTAITATKKSKATAAEDDEEDNEQDEDEEDAHSGGESGSDYDESEKNKLAKKKKVVAATKAKRAPRKPKSSKIIEDDDDEDDAEEAEDADEKVVKPAKTSTKTTTDEAKSSSSGAALDADVQAKVKQIIEQGNDEELTVKKIVRQLSEELGRDLSGEKNAIKEFIKAQ